MAELYHSGGITGREVLIKPFADSMIGLCAWVETGKN
jgi:hypothetical protein